MRAMLLSTVGLMALAVSSGIGLAADLIVETPVDVPASMFDWGGGYAGVVIGGGQTNVNFDDAVNDAELQQGSLAASVVAGYNWVDGSLVYGIEGDIGVIRGSGDVTDQTDSVWTDGSLNGLVGTLRGRLGYATENLLLYGTAGLAISADDLDLDYWSSDAVRVGAVVGVGVEVAVTDSMSLKAEGRYYAFGEGEAEESGYTYTSNSAVALVGVNFHF